MTSSAPPVPDSAPSLLPANYQQVLDCMPDGVLVLCTQPGDTRWRFMYANKVLLHDTGLEHTEIVGKYCSDLLGSAQADDLDAFYQKASESESAIELELPFEGPWGRRSWQVRANGIDIPELGRCVLAVARDTTSSHELSHHLSTLSDYLPGFVYQIRYHPDRDRWEYTHVGRRVRDMFGLTPEVVLNDANQLLGRIHPDDQQRVITGSLETAVSLKPWHCEFRMFKACGDIMWLSAHDLPQRLSDGTVIWTGYAEDITEKKQLEESLRISEALYRNLAASDPLTGLPNRSALMSRLQQMINIARASHSQIAVLFIDLDHFKPVNDQYGHAVGDELLIQTGERLQSCLRASDVVGRLGGDEFLVLLVNPGGQSKALEIANKLCEALAQPFVLSACVTTISACVGIALYPEHGNSPESLISAADDAMYVAKSEGRNRVQLSNACVFQTEHID